MTDPVALKEQDLDRISEHIKSRVRDLAEDMMPRDGFHAIGAQLLEQAVRVEQELKARRELVDERFGFTKERSEKVYRRYDGIIALSNWRFDHVITNSDKRFRAVNWGNSFRRDPNYHTHNRVWSARSRRDIGQPAGWYIWRKFRTCCTVWERRAGGSAQG